MDRYINGNGQNYQWTATPAAGNVSPAGNDITGSGTIGAPWATLTKAVSLSATDGDTIYLADGTYNEAGAVINARKNLTINPDNSLGCTIRAASGSTRVIHFNRISASSSFVLGAIIIDAQKAQDACITTDSVNNIDLITLHGTKLTNAGSRWIQVTKLSSLVLDQNWNFTCDMAGITGDYYGLNFGSNLTANSALTASDGSIDITGVTAAHRAQCFYLAGAADLVCNLINVTMNVSGSSNSCDLIPIYCATTPCSLNISNCHFNVTGTASDVKCIGIFGVRVDLSMSGTVCIINGMFASIFGVYGDGTGIISITGNYFIESGTITTTYSVWVDAQSILTASGNVFAKSGTIGTGNAIHCVNVSSVDIYENTVDYSGATLSTHGSAFVINNGVGITTHCHIYQNLGNVNFLTDSYAICIGNDGDPGSSAHHVTAPVIWGNDFSNANHSYFFGYITGGKAWNNIARGCTYGMIAKYSINNQYWNNIIIGGLLLGGALRGKGGSGHIWTNNTIIFDHDYSVGQYCTDNGLNMIWENNVIYAKGYLVQSFTTVETGSTATFLDYNLYYSDEAPNYVGQYGSISAATWGSWQAAGHDLHSIGITTDPLFIDAPSGNFGLKAPPTYPVLSPLIGAGADSSGIIGHYDFFGNYRILPDIGAICRQDGSSDSSSNLCRALMSRFSELDAGGNHGALWIAISGRLYEGQALEDTAFPFVVYSVVSETKEKTFTEEYTNTIIRFDIFSATSPAQCRELNSLIYNLYEETDINITGSKIIWARMMNKTGGSEPEMITSGPGTPRVWHETSDYEFMTVLN